LQNSIDLDRDDLTGPSRERLGQRAHPGTDLQDDIAWAEIRTLDEDIEQVQIDQKVLTVLGLWL
jgi:hypothetical protein